MIAVEVGMYTVQKSLFCETADFSPDDTTNISSLTQPTDPWLFTDPSAIRFYQRIGLIERLEEDIRGYVMFDGAWDHDELEFKLEIQRMVWDGLIIPKDSIGDLSPHPTVYRTLKEGNLDVSGRRYWFVEGEDLVFEPWLARYSHPALKGPLRVGQLSPVSTLSLCSDAFSHVCIHCDKTRTIMRKILSYRNNGK